MALARRLAPLLVALLAVTSFLRPDTSEAATDYDTVWAGVDPHVRDHHDGRR